MKKLIILISILITLFTAAAIWWVNGGSPVEKESNNSIIFVVRKGDDVREITNRLKKDGLIKNRIVFFLTVKYLGIDKKIQEGDFRLYPSMSASEIAQNLTHGTLDIWVTIPEGKRAEEIAEILKKTLPTFDPSWQNLLSQHEGYLFPDTYLIPKNASLDSIITQMQDNFEKKYNTLNSKQTKLTKHEIVTLASLVEREAKYKEDRPLVASVLLNRLTIGMKLDIDATVQYALGYSSEEKNWWKKNITFEDLKIKSPYNTYLVSGLPPTPIANPGIEALKSVLNPPKTNYLYYISDKSGHNHYARTLQEHNNNIEKYDL